MPGLQPWPVIRRNPEFQSAVIRFVIWFTTFFYLYRPELDIAYKGLFTGYFATYALVLVSVLLRPYSLVRRYFTIFVDIIGVSLLLYAQRTVFSPMILIFVWIYIGYGFRYGIHFLLIAAGATLAGVATVSLALDTWSSDRFGTGLMLLILGLLPLYQYSLQKRLERARAAAEVANRVKNEFLSTMSHELRTPLTTIVGMGQLLAETPLNPEQTDYLRSLRASAGVLRTHIQDLLDVARIGAHELALEMRPFQPDRMVVDVARALAENAHAKGLALYAWISPRLPASLIGDELRLRQILRHLLDNAVKFTERGEVRLAAEWQAGKDEGSGALRLRVEDTGVGIPAEKLPSIFEPFWQGDGSLARTHKGAGLGTTMVKALAELMGGSVSVTSTVGAGSVFEVDIPFAAASVTPPPPAPAGMKGRTVLIDSANRFETAVLVDYCHHLGCTVRKTEGADTRSMSESPDFVMLTESASADLEDRLRHYRQVYGEQTAVVAVFGRMMRDLPVDHLEMPFGVNDLYKSLQDSLDLEHRDAKEEQTGTAQAPPSRPAGAAHRVLVVEDDPDISRLIEALLEMKGCTVQTVADGFQALDRFDDGAYDLLLVDLRMPRMDGQPLAREWRAREEASARPRAPMVALTADTLASVREQTLAAGMDDFLTKPVEPDELFKALARLVPGCGQG